MKLFSLLFGCVLFAMAQSSLSKTTKTSFQTGVELFEKSKFSEAKPYFVKSLSESALLKSYAQYYLAALQHKLGENEEAFSNLQEILKAKPKASEELTYRSLFLASKIHEAKELWGDARMDLSQLSRKWRYSPFYGEVLYNLTRAELKMNRRPAACKIARQLYSRFPQHELLTSWGIDLHANQVDGVRLGCDASLADVAKRIRYLQLSGQSERARAEVLELRSKLEGSNLSELTLIYSRFLVNEGMIDEALSLLMREFPKQKHNFDYLMQLAFAAARGGEARLAIGAYERAHKLSPRSKDGREALYQAAFLSYQFQDYDGAIRKFGQFIKEHPRSGLSKDAKWHLAWLKYLRSDFKGAIESFQSVRNENKKRRRGGSLALEQKLLYWQSMAHLRLDEISIAAEGFRAIKEGGGYSFYSMLSEARLTQVSAELKKKEKEERIPANKEEVETISTQGLSSVDEEEESEEKLAEEDTESIGGSEEVTVDEQGGEVIKDAVLNQRLQVAQSLMKMGMDEWARWELYEIEKKSRSPQIKKRLIGLYEKLAAYHRSSRISELRFGMERERLGYKGAEMLWKSMFPKAYDKEVLKEAKSQGIEPEWIWSIMRAESHYKPDVISPVGAKGLMQIMPFTAQNLARLRGDKKFDVQDLFVPETNIALGSQYLARLGKTFSNSFPVVAASYNAGPHRVKGWLMNFGHLEVDEFIEHIPFLETRNYVKKVLKNQHFYHALYDQKLAPPAWIIQPLGVPIPQKLSARENWEAL